MSGRNAETAMDESSALFAEIIERGMEYAARLVDYDTARDVSHEIAVDVWERRRDNPSLLATPGEVGPYVYRAVYNRVLNVMRARKRRLARELADTQTRESRAHPWMQPSLELEERELAERIRRAIDAMPPRARSVYLRVREDGLSYQDVGREMGISVKTVQDHIVRAQALLRKALAEAER